MINIYEYRKEFGMKTCIVEREKNAKTVLFQGDSITDAGRDRDSGLHHGFGYPSLVASSLGFEYPGEYIFLNKGVGGNRILDVYARIVCDILNHKPDYMSLLIGVNDIWHGIDWANGTGEERFERMYRTLIEDLKKELPNLRIMLLEPFVLEGRATVHEDQPNRYQQFYDGVHRFARITEKIACDYSLTFVPLQQKFDEACQKMPATYWTWDGVHPSHAGHELIKREWLKAFQKMTGAGTSDGADKPY